MRLRIFISQLLMGLSLYTRKPGALFWLVCFPVAMLLVLGTVFGNKSDTQTKLVWARALPASSADEQLQGALEDGGLTFEVLPKQQAETRWQSGSLIAMLESDGGNYTLRVNTYFGLQGRQIEAQVQQGFLIAQARVRGGLQLERIPVVKSSPGGRGDGPYVAYLLPGLLGLNLLMIGVFSSGVIDVTMRAKGGYKRLATTPLPRYIYLAAQLCVRVILGLVSATLLIVVGALVFGVHNQGSYLSLLALAVLGGACFISLGHLLASFATTPESYDGLANSIFLPLMLVSGVYFTLDRAPLWLQRSADLLPLAPMLKALRAIFNDGASIATEGSVLLIIGAWTVVLFTLAVKRFKWI